MMSEFRNVDTATDLIAAGESAIVLFTEGAHFEHYSDGTGQTGFWRVDPNRDIDRVIVYERNPQTGANTVYVADHAGAERRPDQDNRYLIHLDDVHSVGTTDNDWSTFAGRGQNPVRYIP